jgi:hypothetical protein
MSTNYESDIKPHKATDVPEVWIPKFGTYLKSVQSPSAPRKRHSYSHVHQKPKPTLISFNRITPSPKVFSSHFFEVQDFVHRSKWAAYGAFTAKKMTTPTQKRCTLNPTSWKLVIDFTSGSFVRCTLYPRLIYPQLKWRQQEGILRVLW